MDPDFRRRALKFVDELNLDAWVRERWTDDADPNTAINWEVSLLGSYS